MKKKKLTATLLALSLLIGMALPVFAEGEALPPEATPSPIAEPGDAVATPTTLIATEEEIKYSASDIAVINKIIEDNHLNAQKDDPAGWEELNIVMWQNFGGEHRITYLSFFEKEIVGELDLSGLDALTQLECWNTKISKLDVSNLTSLEMLNCGNTAISELDVSNLTSLERLNCGNTAISELDVSNLTSLEWLNCGNTAISELDVSDLTSLKQLECWNTKISKLDVGNLTSLEWLNCSNTAISELDVSVLTQLKHLSCDNTEISKLDVGNLTLLERLSFRKTLIVQIDLSKLSELKSLQCDNTKLTKLDAKNSTKLETLLCGGNNIAELDVSGLTALKWLRCSLTLVEALDVSNLASLEQLECDNTKIDNLNTSNLVSLKRLNCGRTQIASLDLSKATSLEGLSIAYTPIKTIDLSANTNLTSLSYSNDEINVSNEILSRLKNLNVSKITKPLDWSHLSGLTALSVYEVSDDGFEPNWSYMPDLENVYFASEQLKTMDISALSKVNYINSIGFSNSGFDSVKFPGEKTLAVKVAENHNSVHGEVENFVNDRQIKLTAFSIYNDIFKHWKFSDGTTVTDNPCTVTMDKDVTVTAVWEGDKEEENNNGNNTVVGGSPSYSGSGSSTPTPTTTPSSDLTTIISNSAVSANTPKGTEVEVPSSIGDPTFDTKEIAVNAPEAKAFVDTAANAGFAFAKVFQMNLFNGTTKVTKVEDGRVKIALPFEGKAGFDYIVLRYETNGGITAMPALYKDGQITFTTDHFSLYAIAVASTNKNLFADTTVKPAAGTSVPQTAVCGLTKLF